MAKPGILQLLTQEHREIVSLLERVPASEQSRWELFPALYRLLVSHGRAEERVVYVGALGRRLSGEHRVLDEALDELTRLDSTSPAWETTFAALRVAVQQHLQLEEDELFSELASRLSGEEADELERRYRSARRAEAAGLEESTTHSWREPETGAAPWLR